MNTQTASKTKPHQQQGDKAKPSIINKATRQTQKAASTTRRRGEPKHPQQGDEANPKSSIDNKATRQTHKPHQQQGIDEAKPSILNKATRRTHKPHRQQGDEADPQATLRPRH